MRIGIVGSGHIGQAVARLSLRHGHDVVLSNARGPQSLTAMVAALGCEAGTVDSAVAFGDLVVLAIPLKNYPALPAAVFAGKIVLDTGNYYPQRDGQIAELDDQSQTTSGLAANLLPGARIVKAFNAILAAEIETDAKPAATPGRRALPIAGDDGAAKQIAAGYIDGLGFDVVDVGALAESWRIERARPAYCVAMDKVRLQAALAATTRTTFVAEGSWRR